MTISGAILVGGEERQSKAGFRAVAAATGEPVGPRVSEAGARDVADACALAAGAAEAFGALAPGERAAFLEDVGEAILAIGEPLVETATMETGLARTRIENERGRTVNQLRLFAAELRKGEWLDVTIDPPLPGKVPPRPDLRRMNVPLGPVAVFGASNFPLAFSVAGGDTASAFAAGCPVVVKGHWAHPGTGELVARAIGEALRVRGLPPGIFSFLPGRANALGEALVADPRIKAAGFTGSRAGGLALAAVAARRPQPIPVYAEMSSVNPVVLMPRALAARAEVLAQGFIGSLTLGAGQFCTNPGLALAVESADLDRFIAAAAAALAPVEPGVMLTAAIHESYDRGVAALDGNPAVRRVAAGAGTSGRSCAAALFSVAASDFLADSALAQEVFGAAAVIVRCRTMAELGEVLASLEGQLTATIQLEPEDGEEAGRILPQLREKAGRVIANGWPTGVEVTPAMVHGGPYPATSDGRTSSVGTLAMQRFLRPVCYQDTPDALLPPALQASNPWGVPRKVDGAWERAR